MNNKPFSNADNRVFSNVPQSQGCFGSVFHMIWYTITFFLMVGWLPIGMLVGQFFGVFWGILAALSMIGLFFMDVHYTCWTEDQQGNRRNWKDEIVED